MAGESKAAEKEPGDCEKLLGYVLFWIEEKIKESKGGKPVDWVDLVVLKTVINDYMAAIGSQ